MTTTIDQPLFDVAPLVTPDYEPELSLAERYEQFRAANPAVLDVFEALTEQWLAAGRDRVSIKFIAETARWVTGVRSVGEEWAINNSYVAFISRDLLERRPEWREAISLRVQKAAA